MTREQLIDAFENDALGAVYRGSDDYKLQSEKGEKCTIKPHYVYNVVYLEIENSIAILEVNEFNAVALMIDDPDFNFLDLRPVSLLC